MEDDVIGESGLEQVLITSTIVGEIDELFKAGEDSVDEQRLKLRFSLCLFFAALIQEDDDWDESVARQLDAYKKFRPFIIPKECSPEAERIVDAEAMGAVGVGFDILMDFGWDQARLDKFLHDFCMDYPFTLDCAAWMPGHVEWNLGQCKKLGLLDEAMENLNCYSVGFLDYNLHIEPLIDAFREAGFDDEDSLAIIMSDSSGTFDNPAYVTDRIRKIRNPEEAYEGFFMTGEADDDFFAC